MTRRDDWFRERTALQCSMRDVLLREADRVSTRFGSGRRAFLGGSMGAMAAMAVLQQTTDAAAKRSFRPPADDAYAETCGGAGFTRADEGTAHDWEVIEQATRAQESSVADTVMNMLRNLRGLHAGFGVDQEVHGTQTATRATRANASDEIVLCGLIHDVGKILSNANHPEIIAAIARPYISYGAYRVLRHHMEFQWKHYGEFILVPTDLRDRYASEDWFADAAQFSDEFDQTSFDPAYDTMPLDEFEPLVRQFFGKEPERENRTAEDCL
jgi:predicted HD phosphohydrolase